MSDAPRRRFPIGLTVASGVSLVILLGLGTWQMQRLAWKQDLIARLETLKTAQPKPIDEVLARAKRGETVDWVRVAAVCEQPIPARPDHVRNAVREGQIVWRVTSLCPLPAASPYREILVDRGLVANASGKVETPTVALAPVGAVVGVLAPAATLSKDAAALLPDGAPSLILMAERETPQPVEVVAAPLPPNLTNRHLEYALTWYGLAGALVAVYAALVRRRMKA
ncbi:SURF1 family protein [Caulobacter mirabilis]|uniref:SURF1-like protein n=1 Tax=Caulobacter mirabilis TaxID=69666 RepID=A0A2D2B1U0_9CAUL|nr:SURF1 family cytochrome oxidase biogenesis protein [Caulobacter mirabilis]ATQ44235.1 hypothetical protein CSW64_18505 [Caulobacter mirabilis]